MKQLAKLAQAIVHGPKLVILDEPTNGLDPPARQRMIRMIREMRETGELHIVLCSHLLRDVEETCEEVLILKQGRIVHYSNLEEERNANLRFVEIETHGDDAGFIEALEELGCECAVAGERRLKMVLSEGIEIRDIYRLAESRESATAPPELPPRHARRHFPESHGDDWTPMAVYKRTYAGYPGPFTPRWSRFLILRATPRAASSARASSPALRPLLLLPAHHDRRPVPEPQRQAS